MKPPGESDGISFSVFDYPIGSPAYTGLDAIDKAVVDAANDHRYNHRFFDTMCIAGEIRDGDTPVEPIPAMAPIAGDWFHKQFLMLIDNAYPPLGESDYD